MSLYPNTRPNFSRTRTLRRFLFRKEIFVSCKCPESLVGYHDFWKESDFVERNKEMASFEKCAKGLLDLILDATGHDLVYRELSRMDPKFKGAIPFEAFCQEYVPLKLSLGCVYWIGCCANHKITDKEIKNLFFRSVMDLFETPKSLDDATRFSECLYASNVNKDEAPILSVVMHLFHKLKLEAMMKSEEEDPEVKPGFRFMIEVCEALKTVFENQFDDFIYSQDDF